MPDQPPELPDEIATLAGTVGARWNLALANARDPARAPLTDATWTAAAHDGGALLERYGIAFAIVPAQMIAGVKALGQHGAYALVERQAAPPAAVALDWTFETDLGRTFDLLFPSKRQAIASAIVLRGTGQASQESSGALVPCTIRRWHAGTIELACTSPEPAYAVVSSSATRGWSVTVDDRAQPWLVADVIRRAVAVPQGAHHIVWTYRPAGFVLGLVLAALGIALLVALSLTGGAPDPASDPAAVRADCLRRLVRDVGGSDRRALRRQRAADARAGLAEGAALDRPVDGVRLRHVHGPRSRGPLRRRGRRVGVQARSRTGVRGARGRLGARAVGAGAGARERGARRGARVVRSDTRPARHHVHDRSAERGVAQGRHEARLHRDEPAALSRRGSDRVHSPAHT